MLIKIRPTRYTVVYGVVCATCLVAHSWAEDTQAPNRVVIPILEGVDARELRETSDGRLWLFAGDSVSLRLAYLVGDDGAIRLDAESWDFGIREIRETKDGRVWLLSGHRRHPGPAYVMNSDGAIRFLTESGSFGIREISESKDGRRWLLSGYSRHPGPASVVNGSGATPVTAEDTPIAVREIRETKDGRVWLLGFPRRGGTGPGPVYIVDDGGASPVTAEDTPILATDVRETKDGRVWLLAGPHSRLGPAYVMDGGGATPVTADNTPIAVSDVRETKDGRVWLLTVLGFDRGPAYVVNGGGATPVTADNRPIAVSDVRETKDGRVWLLTGTRMRTGTTLRLGPAYLVADAGATAMADGNTRVRDVKETRDSRVRLLSGSRLHRGPAYAAHGDIATPISTHENEAIEVREMRETEDGRVWLLSGHENNPGPAYVVDGDVATAFPDRKAPIKVREIVETKDGRVWLLTGSSGLPGPAYLLVGDDTTPITDEDTGVRSVTETKDGRVWLLTQPRRGGTGSYVAYVPNGARAVPLSGANRRVRDVTETNDGRVWLLTGTAKEPGPAYVVDGDGATPLPDENTPVKAAKVVESKDGRVWLLGDGLYRVDENVRITAEIRTHDSSLWKSFVRAILGSGFLISGVVEFEPADIRYCLGEDGPNPYGGMPDLDPQFKTILETELEEFIRRRDNLDYTLPHPTHHPLNAGYARLHLSVRDRWGNTFEYHPQVRVVPGPAVVPLLLAVLGGMLAVGVVGLAPTSNFCHRLVMNPFVRKIGSFGLIPLFLTLFAPAGRHLLRRYRAALRDDEEFREWRDRFVVPAEDFQPQNFGARLEDRRALYLHGQSGIGKTSFLRYLTWCFAARSVGRLRPRRTIPVFLPLARYRRQPPMDIFLAQLQRYGNLTDTALAEWFLSQGGFVIFIDGLNEIDEEARDAVSAFVDRYSKTNYFCVSSQVTYPEFDWLAPVAHPPLDDERIREFIRRRLPNADAVCEQFTAETYELCRIPQNLEALIGLLERGHPLDKLPRTLPELYLEMFRPIQEEWEEQDRSDFAPLVYERAFEMLCTRQSVFDRPDVPFPDELRNPLCGARFLLQRGKDYMFRHDRVRAFFAAQHVRPHWEELINGEEVDPDSNWQPMLEFVLLEFEEQKPAGELMLSALKRNTVLARDLYSWLRRSKPDLIGDWDNLFRRRVGDAMLDE